MYNSTTSDIISLTRTKPIYKLIIEKIQKYIHYSTEINSIK